MTHHPPSSCPLSTIHHHPPHFVNHHNGHHTQYIKHCPSASSCIITISITGSSLVHTPSIIHHPSSQHTQRHYHHNAASTPSASSASILISCHHHHHHQCSHKHHHRACTAHHPLFIIMMMRHHHRHPSPPITIHRRPSSTIHHPSIAILLRVQQERGRLQRHEPRQLWKRAPSHLLRLVLVVGSFHLVAILRRGAVSPVVKWRRRAGRGPQCWRQILPGSQAAEPVRHDSPGFLVVVRHLSAQIWPQLGYTASGKTCKR